MAKRKLGEVLIHKQSLSPATLDAAMEAQKNGAGRLGEVLLAHNLVSKHVLAEALQEVTGVGYLDCSEVACEPDALALIPFPLAQRHCALPVRRHGKRLLIIMAEPQNLFALDELRFSAGMDLETRFAFRDELARAITQQYTARHDGRDAVARMVADLGGMPSLDFVTTSSRYTRTSDPEADAELHAEHTPAVRVVSAVISAAVGRGASDIHFEQAPNATEVRIRVDGVRYDLAEIPGSLRGSIVSRIKILADLDISEKRMPQDGSFLVRIGSGTYDMRVSTLPTQNGEKVVLRILNACGPSAELRDLGMSPDAAASFADLLRQPQGMILVTGPTGSGKTTTLYASLKMLRARNLNITTVEDPIEYVLEGITQVQVNTRAGRTFASALRSILRQDPNVILIGEIRDQETAEIAVQAAQTGHLVLATLHTNDSFGAIGRLLDLSISRFLLSHSVSAAVGQRLVRKLCSCRVRVPIDAEYRRLMKMGGAEFAGEVASSEGMYSAAGCDECGGSGYKGRVGVYELLSFTHAMQDAVLHDASADAMRVIAAADGMSTMFGETLRLVQSGVTNVEELLRVIPMANEARANCSGCKRALSTSFKYCPHCGRRWEPARGGRELELVHE